MTAVPFDTLRLARKLEAAGFDAKQAGDTAEALAEALSDQVATRADISELRGEVRADFAELRAEVRGDIAEVKADISILKAQIALVQWLIGGVGFGVLLLILRSFWPH